MIHFAPECQINYFHNKLMPVLLNASMWSNLRRIDIEITRYEAFRKPYDGFAWHDLVLCLRPDSMRPASMGDLTGYLRKNMPTHFIVTQFEDHVRVWWRL